MIKLFYQTIEFRTFQVLRVYVIMKIILKTTNRKLSLWKTKTQKYE